MLTNGFVKKSEFFLKIGAFDLALTKIFSYICTRLIRETSDI